MSREVSDFQGKQYLLVFQEGREGKLMILGFLTPSSSQLLVTPQ